MAGKKINSKHKGKYGELEWVEWLKSHGFTEARRGRQFKGTPDSPDVVGGIPGTHCEVKRVERLNIKAAMKKAVNDAGEEQIPYVAHRVNRGAWMVTVLAEDMQRFARKVESES